MYLETLKKQGIPKNFEATFWEEVSRLFPTKIRENTEFSGKYLKNLKNALLVKIDPGQSDALGTRLHACITAESWRLETATWYARTWNLTVACNPPPRPHFSVPQDRGIDAGVEENGTCSSAEGENWAALRVRTYPECYIRFMLGSSSSGCPV